MQVENNQSRLNIEQAEAVIESSLGNLRQLLAAHPAHLQAMEFVCPVGFRPIVEFFEDDRKKRKNASVQNWSPASGEIRISFEPDQRKETVSAQTAKDSAVPEAKVTLPTASSSNQRSELLDALQDAEAVPGRSFVALKWFRDEFLMHRGLTWAQNPEQRQALLSQAITEGWIVTSKAANPKAPLYPTTVIRLNRQKLTTPSANPVIAPVSRFRPVPIGGEPLTSTISRDRGAR